VVGLDLRQGGARQVQIPAARELDVKMRAELRRRRLHLRQGHPDGEPVGIVEVHDPIHAASNHERIRAFLAEERIALRASHQAVGAGAACEDVIARAAFEGVVAAGTCEGVRACVFRPKPITDSGRTRSSIPVPSRSLFGADRNRAVRPV